MPAQAAPPGGSIPVDDRREGDRAVSYWPAADEVDLDKPVPGRWPHCFVVAVREELQRSELVAYGREFARDFDLPPDRHEPQAITRALPERVAQLVLQGCEEARRQNAPLRSEGEIEHPGGGVELYRAVFIPIGNAGKDSPRILGSFSSKLVEPAAAAPASALARLWRRLTG